MAPEVATRESPRSGATSSKASRKAAKKASPGETSGFLGKIFAGAIGAIVLPAVLLVLHGRYTRNETATPDAQELQSALETLQAALRNAEGSKDTAVMTLSGSVSDFVAEHPDGALVEFHMPDCEHCKKLMPEYAAAAKELAASGGPPLASIDGQAYPEIATEHGVDRYPTVLWFRRGKAVQELRHTSRTKDKIIEFVNWVQQPAYTEFETMAEFDEAVPIMRGALEEKSPPIVVGFASSAVLQVLEDVGERLRGKVLFLYVKEPVAEGDGQAPSLRRYAASPDDDSVFQEAVSSETVQHWVESLLPAKKK